MEQQYITRQRKLLNQSVDELNTLLLNAYNNAYQEIYTLLVDTYAKIIDEDGKPLQSHLYQYNRYYNIEKKLQSIIRRLGGIEEKELGRHLTQMYEDNAKIISHQFGLQDHIDEEHVETLLKTDWLGDGSNYSDTIWKNKSQLIVELKKELVNSVITGQSIDKFSKQLQSRFSDVEFWKCKRLVRTEMAHMQLQSTLDKYKEAGIKKYKILATMDARTCEYCADMNDKEFDIDKAEWGVNIPPFHPNCRCTIQAVI